MDPEVLGIAVLFLSGLAAVIIIAERAHRARRSTERRRHFCSCCLRRHPCSDEIRGRSVSTLPLVREDETVPIDIESADIVSMRQPSSCVGSGGTSPSRGFPSAEAQLLSDGMLFDVPLEEVVCAICFSEADAGTDMCRLQCGHVFCRECVSRWLEKHCTCPTCRARALHEFEVRILCIHKEKLGLHGVISKDGLRVQKVLDGLMQQWNGDPCRDQEALKIGYGDTRIREGDLVVEVNGTSASRVKNFQDAIDNGGYITLKIGRPPCLDSLGVQM